MRKNLFPTRFQVCALCGKRHATVYKFPFLARYGIKGKYAALGCLGALPEPDTSNVTYLAGRHRPGGGEEH
jgi:hypothetical protein